MLNRLDGYITYRGEFAANCVINIRLQSTSKDHSAQPNVLRETCKWRAQFNRR